MTIVSSVFHKGKAVLMRGKSKNSMFVFQDCPEKLYIMSCSGYGTGSYYNNVTLYSLDLNTLDLQSNINTPSAFGSNCGIIFGLENYNSSYLLPSHMLTRVVFEEQSYSQNIYTFILANFTDFMHNDVPMIIKSKDDVYIGYINSINKDNMIKYFNQDYTNTISPEEYNTALYTSEQILGEEETVNE